jgi:hypothetical protein
MNRREVAVMGSEYEGLLKVLQDRFERNMVRHQELTWVEVRARLEANAEKLRALGEMEATGGEPDVVSHDRDTGEFIFFDSSVESPLGRRSLCYDRAAWQGRRANRPSGSVMDMAEAMGVEVLTEEQYRTLQTLGKFDMKTSSWVRTPERIRKLGGAIFCDRRYDTVFVYHNGAESYYSSRGFRGLLRV